MHQELHSHSGGVVLVWHKKSNMLFLQFPKPTPPHHHNNTMSFFNNNNNNGCRNNCYIVPVPAVTPAPSRPAGAGNSHQLARVAADEAAKHEQDWRMAACIARAASQPGFICCAASNVVTGNKSSSSSRAKNGSHSSRSSPCYTSHIHHGMVTPLPTADKTRRYQSMNVLDCQSIIAQEAADFRSALKAGGFPLLVPRQFLKSA